MKRIILGTIGRCLLLAGIVIVPALAQSTPALPGAYACPPGRSICIGSISPAQGKSGDAVRLSGRFGTNYRGLELKMYRNGRATDMQVQHWGQRNVTATVPRNVRYGTYSIYIVNSVLAGFGDATPLPGPHGVVSNSVHFTIPNPALERLHIDRNVRIPIRPRMRPLLPGR